MIRRAAIAVLVGTVVLTGCGPEGPNEAKGPPADPRELLNVLPVPPGLASSTRPAAADSERVLRVVLDTPPTRAEWERARGAGLGEAATRTFRTADKKGTMVAVVSVWPSNLTAANFSLQLVQRRLGKEGRRAWTPRDIPASHGTRQSQPPQERILVRAVGPNSLVVHATGPVPDEAVATTLSRMVTVQGAKKE